MALLGREFIAVPDDRKGQIVFKWPDVSIRRYTRAIVNADEMAMFVNTGQVVQTLGPGRHQIDANELPGLGAIIDHVSGGRFGMNLVAGWNELEFGMFGIEQQPHDDRYAAAAEWLDIIERRWSEHDLDHGVECGAVAGRGRCRRHRGAGLLRRRARRAPREALRRCRRAEARPGRRCPRAQ